MANDKQVAVVNGSSMLTDTARFEHVQRVANVFANSQLVPSHLRGKLADCVIALNIADRLGEDPLTVMQSIYVVSGKAGWSSSYMIARINQSGAIKGRITWAITGKDKSLEVTAKATLADTGEVVTATATMQMAIAEGWISNKKYQSMPEMMLRYRSAAMLQRLYFPEVMLGMRTVEEIETEPTPAPMQDVTPAKTTASDLDRFAAPTTPAAEIEDAQTVEPDGAIIDQAPAEVPEELEHALAVLAKLSLDEIEGARQGLRQSMAPGDFVVWNTAALERTRALKGRRA